MNTTLQLLHCLEQQQTSEPPLEIPDQRSGCKLTKVIYCCADILRQNGYMHAHAQQRQQNRTAMSAHQQRFGEPKLSVCGLLCCCYLSKEAVCTNKRHACTLNLPAASKPYPEKVDCSKRHMADGYAAQSPHIYLVKGTVTSCLELITLADEVFYFLADITQVLHAAEAAAAD
jgi:hypothetical protein